MYNDILKKTSQVTIVGLDEFKESFKSIVGKKNNYWRTENTDWSEGFHSGILWLAYENTGEKKILDSLNWQLNSFKKRLEEKKYLDTHDIGFLYSLSCVAGYKITGDKDIKKIALTAADVLISRYQEKGKFIQAWGKLNADGNYRLIIDCLMNLPLLYWAAEETGENKYKEIAEKHLNTTLKTIIRDDNSTYHTFFFDPETGEELYGKTAQGYSDTSFWSRGQAWGIYGIALSYSYLRDVSLIEKYEKLADFFIEHMPEDLIPYWDLSLTKNDNEPRDSSSVAIAACGFLEMAKYCKGEKYEKYKEIAHKIAMELIKNYSVNNLGESNGLLLHSTYCKKSKYNTVEDFGVDECNLFGDYFYMELLMRLSNQDWVKYW